MSEEQSSTWQKKLGATLKNDIRELEYVDWIANHVEEYQFYGDVAQEVKSLFLKYAASPNVYYSSCKEMTSNFVRLFDNNVCDTVLGISDYENVIKAKHLDNFFIPVDVGKQEEEWVYVPVGYVREKLGGTTLDYCSAIISYSRTFSRKQVEIVRNKVIEYSQNLSYCATLQDNKSIKDERGTTKSRLKQYRTKIIWANILQIVYCIAWIVCARHHEWFDDFIDFVLPFGYVDRLFYTVGGGWISGVILIVLLVLLLISAFLTWARNYYLNLMTILCRDYKKMATRRNTIASLLDLIDKEKFFEDDGKLVQGQRQYPFLRETLEITKKRVKLPVEYKSIAELMGLSHVFVAIAILTLVILTFILVV